MQTPAQRLEEVVEYFCETNKITRGNFSKIMGVSPGKLSHLLAGDQKIVPEFAFKLKQQFGVSATWLLWGEDYDGVKFDLGSDENNPSYNIRFYEDIRASAGFGTEAIEMFSHEIMTIPKHAISGKINPDKIHAIKIIGDSMEPKISEGDVAFVEAGAEFVKDGCIYVMKIDDDIYIKRIYKSPDNMYFIRSDNKEYPEFKVDRSKVKIIGKVVYLLSQFGK